MKKLVITTSLEIVGFITILFVVAFAIVMFVVAASNPSTRYRDNFLQRYYETINVMFDNNWTLLVEEHMVREGDCQKRYGSALEWIRWEIEYTNTNGEVRQFRFTNTRPFYRQVETYVSSLIRHNFQEYFKMSQVRLLRGNRFMDLHQNWYRTTHRHIQQFSTPAGAVRLSQLTLENAFELLPMYISVGIGLSDGQTIEDAMEIIEYRLESLNSLTNNRLNMNVIARLDDTYYRWYYLNGELFRELDGMRPTFTDDAAFEVYVFNALRGVFW